jgi:phosphomevalonate kinase
MQLLCISGKRESGKSLLASYLEHYHGWARFSLADDLKRRALKDFNLTTKQLWGNEKESPTQYIRTDGSNYTARDILIRMGTFYRSIDKLFWCKQFDPRIGDKIVIDDLRFLNEIKYFTENYEAKAVRLNRSQEAIGKAALDDLSETEMDSYKDYDWVLPEDENKSPADLQRYAEYLNIHFERANLSF